MTGQRDPGFDPRVADWLEADPDRAPSQVLETVMAALPSIPQRRALRVPWRSPQMTRFAIGVAAAAVIAAVTGIAILPRLGPGPGINPSMLPTVSPSPIGTPGANGLPPGGRLLLEHLGNALDMSEFPTEDAHPDRRRFYLIDPADMSPRTAVEFLPGQPATGKTAADVSSDGRRVVFQDWAVEARLYEANLDGTGFRKLPLECDQPCAFLYPDYDPTGTKVVYVRVEDGRSRLEYLDLVSGDTYAFDGTEGPADDDVPEQPAWSPDGRTIAFSRLTWNGEPAVVGTVHYGDVPPTAGVIQLLDVATDTLRTVPVPADLLPGDVNWSPDSTTLVFTANPASTTGSNGGMPARIVGIHRILVDGSGLRALAGWGGPEYLPDGSRILFQDNVFRSMRPDGTDLREVDPESMDMSALGSGFVYIAHWIPPT
jgi:dipeptidyl aminopeptidase/acylaminoacyl peptidase